MEVERHYLRGRRNAIGQKLDEIHNLQRSARALKERVHQLIEVTDEDHGKAIRVFTIVTVLFLPMYVTRRGHCCSKDSILIN
jgi:Mg2+ and Co2+ transporter CorA